MLAQPSTNVSTGYPTFQPRPGATVPTQHWPPSTGVDLAYGAASVPPWSIWGAKWGRKWWQLCQFSLNKFTATFFSAPCHFSFNKNHGTFTLLQTLHAYGCHKSVPLLFASIRSMWSSLSDSSPTHGSKEISNSSTPSAGNPTGHHAATQPLAWWTGTWATHHAVWPTPRLIFIEKKPHVTTRFKHMGRVWWTCLDVLWGQFMYETTHDMKMPVLNRTAKTFRTSNSFQNPQDNLKR